MGKIKNRKRKLMGEMVQTVCRATSGVYRNYKDRNR